MASYNKAVVDFGKGWTLVGIEQYPSQAAIQATGDSAKAYAALAAAGVYGYCRLCGHDIKDCYIVEKDGKRESVGSECIRKVMDDDRKGLQLERALKAVADKAKRDWERPYKQAQVAEYYRANRATIQQTGYSDYISFRVHNETNPDMTAREIKAAGLEFSWRVWTEPEKAARTEAVAKAIRQYIDERKGAL